MFYEAVADAAVAAHFGFLALGILGGFVAWRWGWVLWLQAAAVTWMVLVVAARLPCPLTWVEDRARVHAGLRPLPGGFLDNYAAGVFYPHGHERAAQLVVALIVLSSWAGLAVVRRRRRRAVNPSPPRRSPPGRVAPG